MQTWCELRAGRCVVVGEVAQAHDGSLGTAHAYVDAIAAAGADAVKFQTHIATAESTRDEPWRVKFSPQDATRYDYWRRMEFTEEQWRGLRAHAYDRGLLFLSSPFSLEAVQLLERVGVAAWKVASGEVSNTPMIERMAATGLPVLLSSGMSGWAELDRSVEVVRRAGTDLTVFQCTSSYPCPPECVGLNLLDDMRRRYQCCVGLSDHSGTIFPALAAATLHVDALEVHVALSREVFGPDVPASVTSSELRQLVEGVRFIERMLGNPVNKDVAEVALSPLRSLFTKSIVARHRLARGAVLDADDLALKKPGSGIPPERLPEVVGRRLCRDVASDAILSEDDLE